MGWSSSRLGASDDVLVARAGFAEIAGGAGFDAFNFDDSGHQLTIVGDSGDKVSSDLSGHSVAVTDMGAVTHYVIAGGAAMLDVDNHVQKNIIGV